MSPITRAALISASLLAATAVQAEPVKIGILTSYSGITATSGQQTDNAIKLFLQENGDTIGDKKLEFVRRDSTGPNPDVVKRLGQELIFREKVQILHGIDFTPNVLALAPVLTEGKTPGIITGAATSGTVAQKSPYYARTFMTLSQISRPMAQWALKNNIKKIYTVVADYAPGHESEGAFIDEFTKGGGTVVDKLRVPTRNPEFSPYMQRIRDAKPDAIFAFMPVGELSVGLLQAYSASGLAQVGIKLIGTGDLTDEGYLDAAGNAALGVVTAFIYSNTHDSQMNRDFIRKYEALNGKDLRIGISSVATWDGLNLIRDALLAQNGTPFNADAFMKFIAGRKMESPRGPIQIDEKSHDIIQNVYIRRVDRIDGTLQNVEIDTIPNVQPD